MDRLEENFGRRLSSNKNRDPGVNSDEEEEDMMFGERDDMFQFDRLSHCSSLRSELSLSRLGKHHHHHHHHRHHHHHHLHHHRHHLYHHPSLTRLGTVSPAASTPDLEAMRRPDNRETKTKKVETSNVDLEVARSPSNLSEFESMGTLPSSELVKSARKKNNVPEPLDLNMGWQMEEMDRRSNGGDLVRNMEENGQVIDQESLALHEHEQVMGGESLAFEERPPSAETVAEDYSLPSYHQVGVYWH